jgi:hypothetical protein
MMMMMIIPYAQHVASKQQKNGMNTHSHTQYVNLKMWRSKGIKGYTKIEKLRRCQWTEMSRTKAAKKLKYNSLCTQIQRMCNMKCMIIRVINSWGHWNSNKSFKEKFVSHTRKTFNTFTTKYSCTCNTTHNTESTAVWNLKPEWWGQPMVQEEKYLGEKGDKRYHHHDDNIIKTSNPLLLRSSTKHEAAPPRRHLHYLQTVQMN